MTNLSSHLDHLKHVATEIQDEIASFAVGEMEVFEITTAGRHDITAEILEERRRQLGELRGVIAAIEKGENLGL